jgi:hypothetical protein
VAGNHSVIGGLTQGTRAASEPGVTDNQSAIWGQAQGTNLRAPGVTDSQSAIGSLAQGTNLGVGRECQTNRSHYC